MHTINLQTWPRRQHFELFLTYDYPHFNLCAPVDITGFYQAVKSSRASFTTALIYVLARAANALPEFRQRIRGREVVEHEVVHPAPTILTGEDLFGFYSVPFVGDYLQFAALNEAAVARAKESRSLVDEPGRDDWLFMTGIPWVSFTGIIHPIHLYPADSVPRLAWGKFYPEGDRLKLPLSVQVHHALMDGIHVGRYYEQVQAGLDRFVFTVQSLPE